MPDDTRSKEEKADKNDRREPRSPRYPTVSLGQAVALAQQLWEKERKTSVPPEVAIKAWGHDSLNGSSRAKLAALKHYDLLADERQGVRVSDLAIEILQYQHEEGSEPYLAAMRRAAMTPALFKELSTRFPEASDDAIKRDLVFAKGFPASAAETAIRIYRETLAAAKLPPTAFPATQAQGSEKDSTEKRNAADPFSALLMPFKAPEPKKGGVRVFSWPLAKGVTAELKLTWEGSQSVSPGHLKRLRQYLEVAESAIADEEIEDADDLVAGAKE